MRNLDVQLKQNSSGAASIRELFDEEIRPIKGNEIVRLLLWRPASQIDFYLRTFETQDQLIPNFRAILAWFLPLLNQATLDKFCIVQLDFSVFLI